MEFIVYRIQSKQDRTRGAYRTPHQQAPCPDVLYRMYAAHMDYERGGKHPEPKADIGRRMESDEYCGFNSAADLLRWFRGFIPDLLRSGYEIVALRDVTITAIGEKQVLFKWKVEVNDERVPSRNPRNVKSYRDSEC